jgi:hypothetical protein
MASNDFLDAFVIGGGPVEECEFCGNTFYSSSSWDMSEEDSVYFEELRAKHPDKYFPEPYDSFEFYIIDNRRYVYGCPCNALDKYEQFVWEHRPRILRYIQARSKTEYERELAQKLEVEKAVEMHESAKKVAAALVTANRRLANAKDYC